MSAPHAFKTLSAVHQRLVDRLTEGVDVVKNGTEADVEHFFHSIFQTEKAASSDVLKEVHAQLHEAVTKHLMDGSIDRMEAEAWSSSYIKALTEKAEQVRKHLPPAPASIKLPFLKLVGATMALATAGIAYFGITSGKTPQEQSNLDFLTRTQAENQEIQRATITTYEFNGMVSGLKAASAAPMADKAAAPAAASASVELPPEIAPIAAAPVSLSITTAQGPQPTIHTTVAQAYRYAPPPVRRVMVQQWHIDHIYDHPDEERDPQFLEHSSQPYHKTVDIQTDFGVRAQFDINH